MTHNERVTNFLAARGLTMADTVNLSLNEKSALDAAFRAERRAEFASWTEGATQLSRKQLFSLLPPQTALTLIFAMGGDCEKPRTVGAHRSYGFDMVVEGGKTSTLRFEKGETYFHKDNFITMVDADGLPVVRYKVAS